MPHNWLIAWSVACWILALAWTRQAALVFFGMRRLSDLRVGNIALPGTGSSADEFQLTVIVPARNEEECIKGTLASLIASTGIRLQVIAIDDRSTDDTGRIMELCAKHTVSASCRHSLEVLHLHDLPAGWLGKTHAMHRAVEGARAPLLLFTDADVMFAPDALQRAVDHLLFNKLDHLVLVPSLISKGITESATLALIHSLTQWFTHFWKVSHSEAKDFLGLGGFNLIRADVYRQLGGFSRLRLEVIEDMSLGWMVKRAGYRCEVTVGLGLVNIPWIDGPFGIIRNIEKNGFSLFRYRIWLCMVALLGLLVDIFVPLLAIATGGWSLAAGLLTYFAIGVIYHSNRRINAVTPAAALLFAPCAAVLSYAFARSMVLALINDGITWRETHYPLKDLCENAASWK